MRQTLIQFPTNYAISLNGWQIPVLGFGLLLVIWCVLSAWWAYRHWKQRGVDQELQSQLFSAVFTAAIIIVLPHFLPSISIYGYGMAMVCGFLAAAWLASIRAARENINPALIWDIGVMVLLSGVIGARLFFIVENYKYFFGPANSPTEFIVRLIDLRQGGLVLYGGVLLGIVVYSYYCRIRGLSALKLADIVIPSIFVGEMFGRIGCLLNGCCYGAVTKLPWAVQFPKGSLPYAEQVRQNLIDSSAVCSLPLHPTQIYSSLLALLMAVVTWNYYPRRSRDGEVLLLGWLLYPIARFGVETLRNDTEPYRFFGISLTNAQWVSIGMLVGAAAFAVYLSYRPRLPQQESQSRTLRSAAAAPTGNTTPSSPGSVSTGGVKTPT